MAEPDFLGHIYPSVHIPQLGPILEAFKAQEALLMALSEKLDGLQAAFTQEADELKASFAALRQLVADNAAAVAELNAGEARVEAMTAAFGSFAEEASAEPTP